MIISWLAALLVLVALRLAFIRFRPYRQCRWCRPGGLIGGSVVARMTGGNAGRQRRRGCWRCKGTRLTRRLGAKQVHKTRLAWRERGR